MSVVICPWSVAETETSATDNGLRTTDYGQRPIILAEAEAEGAEEVPGRQVGFQAQVGQRQLFLQAVAHQVADLAEPAQRAAGRGHGGFSLLPSPRYAGERGRG